MDSSYFQGQILSSPLNPYFLWILGHSQQCSELGAQAYSWVSSRQVPYSYALSGPMSILIQSAAISRWLVFMLNHTHLCPHGHSAANGTFPWYSQDILHTCSEHARDRTPMALNQAHQDLVPFWLCLQFGLLYQTHFLAILQPFRATAICSTCLKQLPLRSVSSNQPLSGISLNLCISSNSTEFLYPLFLLLFLFQSKETWFCLNSYSSSPPVSQLRGGCSLVISRSPVPSTCQNKICNNQISYFPISEAAHLWSKGYHRT